MTQSFFLTSLEEFRDWAAPRIISNRTEYALFFRSTPLGIYQINLRQASLYFFRDYAIYVIEFSSQPAALQLYSGSWEESDWDEGIL